MRFLRYAPFVLAFLAPVSMRAQQAPSSTTAPPAPQDPQAVSVLNQVLTIGGGVTAIKAVADYTGSGNIIYHWAEDVQGSVTIMGLRGEFRLDASLSTGTRSWSVSQGIVVIKDEKGAISRFAPQTNAPSSDAFPYQTPLFASSLGVPYWQLATALNNPIFQISYQGVVPLDGRSVHHIQVQRVLPQQVGSTSEYRTKDFFIDASTLQIVMTQDTVPKHVIHQVRYAAYTAVNGILVPFSISEEMSGQPTWSIQLTQMTFNSGLQDSAFVLQ
jgi:hypothetical protein